MNRLFINKEWSPLKKLLFMNAASGGNLNEYTETGNPVSFTTNVSKPLKQLLIPFSPVQEGSGDPSPENVRPITGWTGVEVTRTGRNLFNVRDAEPYNDKVTFTFGGDGSLTCKNENAYVTNPFGNVIIKAPIGTYTISSDSYPDRNITFYGSDDGVNWTWMANGLSTSVKSRTVSFTKKYVRVNWQVGANETAICPPIMLELGSSVSPYEEYVGTTIPVTFPEEAGTVYGGTLDLTTGVLTATYRVINAKDKTSWVITGNNTAYSNFSDGYNEVTTETPKGRTTIYCNIAKYDSSANGQDNNSIWWGGNPNNKNINIRLDDINTSKDSWLEYIANNDVFICYRLAEPLEFQLTPQQLSTLIGDNVIYTSTNGQNTVKYLKKG